MSSTEKPHLTRLLAHTPRMPNYLHGAADTIMARTEAASTAVSHFLRSPVRLDQAGIERRDPEPVEPGAGDIFDIIDLRGHVAMRISLSAATVASVTRSLFGGDVTERPVLSGIGLSFCCQIAGALISDPPKAVEDGEEPPDPLEGYRIVKASADGIGTRPVLSLTMKFSLVQPPDLELVIDFPRDYTDNISSPDGELGERVLKVLSFPITAIAGQTRIPFGKIRSWKPGDVIQLPGAELSKMKLQVSTGHTVATLASGDLGAKDGMKSVRLNDISANPGKAALRAAG